MPFDIDDYTRWRLLEGLDDIGLTLRDEESIAEFEAHRESLAAEDPPHPGAGRIRESVNTLGQDAKNHGSAVGLNVDRITINGGKPLRGRIELKGAKNLVTKAMVAAILGDTPERAEGRARTSATSASCAACSRCTA